MIADFESFHAALKAALQSKFNAVVNVYDYKPDPEKLTTPALIVSLDSFRADEEFEPGQDLTLETEFSIYCLLDNSQPNPELQVRLLAADVALVLKNASAHNFDNVGRPENIFALAAEFLPGSPKYSCWEVSWQQVIELPYKTDADQLVDFITYHADHQQAADAPVASDEIIFS